MENITTAAHYTWIVLNPCMPTCPHLKYNHNVSTLNQCILSMPFPCSRWVMVRISTIAVHEYSNIQHLSRPCRVVLCSCHCRLFISGNMCYSTSFGFGGSFKILQKRSWKQLNNQKFVSHMFRFVWGRVQTVQNAGQPFFKAKSDGCNCQAWSQQREREVANRLARMNERCFTLDCRLRLICYPETDLGVNLWDTVLPP